MAAADETPNIAYTDTDRFPMDVGRIAHNIGFNPRFTPREALAGYLEWLRRTPDFWDSP